MESPFAEASGGSLRPKAGLPAEALRHTTFASPSRGFNEGKTAKRSLSGASIKERLRLKSRRHEQAWFGGGQGS